MTRFNYRITLAYDGSEYEGWQMQQGDAPTIQLALSRALARIDGAPVIVHGAGRTDAGVHAEGQVASFRLARQRDGAELRRALNGNLPEDIRVIEAAPAEVDFHARFSARSKTYRYQIYTAEVMNPFLRRYSWHYPYALDTARMYEDSRALLGRRDFSAFTVAASEARSHVRTITGIEIDVQGPMLRLTFTGDGFLRYMVRTIVGALVEADRGRLKAGSLAKLLETGDRALVGASAPARGLTMVKVEY
ncbi:MAG: tRNA pseudouridine(38-40) synthase TruA [Acidobacteria bacterium]|nr:tRNA pseudouridine(38-40) synthase TruA [Acidobacteriota bacterium]